MNNLKETNTKESKIRIYPPEKPTVLIDNGVRRANLPEKVYLDLYMQITNDVESVAIVENEFCKMTAQYDNGMVVFNLSCANQEGSIHVLNYEKFEIYALVVSNKVDFTERLKCDYSKYETVNLLSVLVPTTHKRTKQITFNNGALWEYVCESRFLSAYQKFTEGITDECKVNKDYMIYFFNTEDPAAIAIMFYNIQEERPTSQHIILKSYIQEYIEAYVMKSKTEKK